MTSIEHETIAASDEHGHPHRSLAFLKLKSGETHDTSRPFPPPPPNVGCFNSISLVEAYSEFDVVTLSGGL